MNAMKMNAMKLAIRLFVALPLLSAFSVSSFAAPCPTSGTLAGAIALGNCSIGDATVFFTSPPAFPPPPPGTVYFPGPFAGDSGAGPSSSQIQFTPIADSGNPGFTLTGPFTATGGSLFDESLGFLHVALPAGQSFMGASVALTGAVVSTDNASNIVRANLQTSGASLFALLRGDGISQLSEFSTLTGGPFATLPVLINLSTWNRSSNTASVSKFDAVTVHFQESTSPIPEPEIYAMILAGLGLMGFVARRRRQKDAAG